jgi:hypothetical protein
MGLWDWLEDLATAGEVVFDIATTAPQQIVGPILDIAVPDGPFGFLEPFIPKPEDPQTGEGGVYKGVPYEGVLTPEITALIDQKLAERAAENERLRMMGVTKARKQLNKFLLAGGLITGVPAAYALYTLATTKKGEKLSPRKEMMGRSLENFSSQATGAAITALASPVIATAAAYILIQKLEDAEYISRGLGNAAQTLLTVAAAGPAISGIGGIVGSAFKAIPKGAKA